MKMQIAAGVVALALGMAMGAVAGTRQSVSVELFSPASLNGTEIPAGNYKVSWTGEGNQVQVTFAGKKVRAEAKGTLVERDSKAQASSVVSRKNGNGVPTIAEVRLGGEKRVLVIAGS